MAMTTSGCKVRRGLSSEFNSPLGEDLPGKQPGRQVTPEKSPTMTNGDVQDNIATPPRPPPPIPHRTSNAPLRVSVTEVGGFPADGGEGKIKLLEQEIAALKKEARSREKCIRKLEHKLDRHESISKAKKVWLGMYPSVCFSVLLRVCWT